MSLEPLRKFASSSTVTRKLHAQCVKTDDHIASWKEDDRKQTNKQTNNNEDYERLWKKKENKRLSHNGCEKAALFVRRQSPTITAS